MFRIFQILLISLSYYGIYGQQCFVPGECPNNEIIFAEYVDNQEACLEECRSFEDCKWFTFNRDSNRCFLYKSCSSLSVELCRNCVSGEVSCSSTICNSIGLCEGDLLLSEASNDSNECLIACKDNLDCTWFSFSDADKSCFQFSTCPSIDESKTEFVSGQQECPSYSDSKGIVLVTTGFPYPTGTKSEVIDLASVDNDCNPLADFPIEVVGATGVLLDAKYPFICGGGDQTHYINYCYILGQYAPVATMMTSRYLADGFALNQTHMLIVGGLSQTSKLATSEIISLSGSSVAGPTLTRAVAAHCVVKVNESMAILIGGDMGTFSSLVYILNIGTMQWSTGPKLNIGRYFHACGSFQHYVVVAGGTTSDGITASVEILDLDNLAWTDGPDLPRAMQNLRIVPNLDGQGVIAMGGFDGSTVQSQFMELRCEQDISQCKWTMMSQKLSVPRREFLALPIPSELAMCKK